MHKVRHDLELESTCRSLYRLSLSVALRLACRRSVSYPFSPFDRRLVTRRCQEAFVTVVLENILVKTSSVEEITCESDIRQDLDPTTQCFCDRCSKWDDGDTCGTRRRTRLYYSNMKEEL
jgi:hypothetical protein